MLEATLVNEPDDDAALFVSLTNRAEAFLFDCGTLHPVRIRDLQRIERVFVSHTHIDHFIGFDHLLRMQLFCPQTTTIYGPQGITSQVGSRLRGYAWNLVEKSDLVIETVEICPDHLTFTRFPCARQFEPAPPVVHNTEADSLELPQGEVLSWCWVEHGVPCLAFCLESPTQQRIDKEALGRSGLKPGPWLADLKSGQRQQFELEGRSYTRTELADQLLVEQAGFKLGYVTDTLFNKQTASRLSELLAGCDELWCEAAYLHSQLDKAREHHHLTARQAGRLAREVQAKRLYLFHQSRRYSVGQALHLEEAGKEFEPTRSPRRYGAESPA